MLSPLFFVFIALIAASGMLLSFAYAKKMLQNQPRSSPPIEQSAKNQSPNSNSQVEEAVLSSEAEPSDSEWKNYAPWRKLNQNDSDGKGEKLEDAERNGEKKEEEQGPIDRRVMDARIEYQRQLLVEESVKVLRKRVTEGQVEVLPGADLFVKDTNAPVKLHVADNKNAPVKSELPKSNEESAT
jgi:hypothetical protein